VSIPFTLGGGERGALCIYATDIHAFDRRAISLLEDLAGDLEFGLRHLRTSDALAASEERYRLLAENTGDVVLLTRDDRIEWASPSALSAFGWAPEELLGRPISEFAHPDEDEVRARLRRDSARGVRDTYRGRVRRKDGTWVWVDVRTRPVLGPDGRPDGSIISTVWDITAEVTAQVALEHAASHDSLTGVANRSLLLDELARALAAGHRSGTHVAVLLVDLDHFKYVNDSLGHAVGDELLCAAAERMHHAVREGDLVARQGGDEFVVVMRDLPDAAEAVVVAERLLEAFRRPITAGGAELFTTASIGVAVAEGADQDGIDLLREADTAMYRAKAEGRDRVSMFNEDLRDTAAQRLQIANELRTAVDRGELEVWYQPEVSLADGHLLAVEALLRWHHPSGATHPAGYFIDTAEETGMILDIGRWVLQEACRQGARWLATHPQRPLAVRVNISSLQLAEAGLLDDLDRALEGAGLAPERLCLEITETAMLHETSTVRANMAGIHHRGDRVAIDDFGTGYASLTYLRRYPIDVVKLDRSFVANLTTRPQDEHIVAGIIDLATRLGITVTAEGVEHEDQADRLHQLGCHSAQGYLYSRAVPPAAIDAVLDVELRPS
jgi:diguanylate cyclase (GGDEF)-like protein/PAS domain S-box-containing protein